MCNLYKKGRKMRREQLNELETKAWFGEMYAKAHRLSEEDLEQSNLIHKMPVEIVKHHIPKTGGIVSSS